MLTELNSEYQFLMRGINSEINKKKSVSLYNHDAPRHLQSRIDIISNTVPGEPLYEKFQ